MHAHARVARGAYIRARCDRSTVNWIASTRARIRKDMAGPHALQWLRAAYIVASAMQCIRMIDPIKAGSRSYRGLDRSTPGSNADRARAAAVHMAHAYICLRINLFVRVDRSYDRSIRPAAGPV